MAPPSDEEQSPSEMPPDEPAVMSKRKSGTTGKKQASAKEFDPFEDDMEDAAADAAKRRRHGLPFSCILTFPKSVGLDFLPSVF